MAIDDPENQENSMRLLHVFFLLALILTILKTSFEKIKTLEKRHFRHFSLKPEVANTFQGLSTLTWSLR